MFLKLCVAIQLFSRIKGNDERHSNGCPIHRFTAGRRCVYVSVSEPKESNQKRTERGRERENVDTNRTWHLDAISMSAWENRRNKLSSVQPNTCSTSKCHVYALRSAMGYRNTRRWNNNTEPKKKLSAIWTLKWRHDTHELSKIERKKKLQRNEEEEEEEDMENS